MHLKFIILAGKAMTFSLAKHLSIIIFDIFLFSNNDFRYY